MENNKQQLPFAEGLMWNRPSDATREKAPWIKGKMLVNVSKFIDFLKMQNGYVSEKGWLALDLKESKDGKTLYFQVNNWKPTEAKKEEIDPSSIPF